MHEEEYKDEFMLDEMFGADEEELDEEADEEVEGADKVDDEDDDLI